MGISTLVAIVALCSIHILAPGPRERAAMVQVRAADAISAHLLQVGMEHSGTFRGLIERIEDSDVVVYVVADRLLGQAGKLQFVHATPRWRYLRVTVRAPGVETERDVVAWLGHELQHVVEVVGAPQIRDDDTLVWHYAHHGWLVGRHGPLAFDTDEADEIKWQVLDELYGG